MSLLLTSQIKNILVVDPHDVFLDLFYQHIKRMIPHVGVVTVKSGEEALRRLVNTEMGSSCSGECKTRRRGRYSAQDCDGGRQSVSTSNKATSLHRVRAQQNFDIIIVEERLHQCRLSREPGDWVGERTSQNEDAPWSPEQSHAWTSSLPLFPSDAKMGRGRQWHTIGTEVRPNAWQSAGEDQHSHHNGPMHQRRRRQQIPMSGSQLLHHIRFMQEQQCLPRVHEQRPDVGNKGLQHCSPLPSKSSQGATPSQRPALLIGVSGWLGEDCEKLRKGGADILWGKPPPIMDNRLRNELLMALLAKRGHPIFICD